MPYDWKTQKHRPGPELKGTEIHPRPGHPQTKHTHDLPLAKREDWGEVLAMLQKGLTKRQKKKLKGLFGGGE
jgi:hypothetical protein